MDSKLFVLRKHSKVPPESFFDGFKFLNPGTGKPSGHWAVAWSYSRAMILDQAYIEQVKKDLWERLKLAEGIDYDRVQVG